MEKEEGGRRKEEGLRRRRTRRKEDEEEAWAEAEAAGGRAWRVVDDGDGDQVVLDDGQDRGEAGKVGEPANSTAREERGGLRCVVCQAAPQSTGRGRRKAGEGRLEKERSKEGVVQWGSLQREREGVVV